MGRGLSQLQRELLAFTDERRRAKGLTPVAWTVTAWKALPPDLAEILTEAGRQLHNQFRKRFKPSISDIVESISEHPRSELWANVFLDASITMIKTAENYYILSKDSDWSKIIESFNYNDIDELYDGKYTANDVFSMLIYLGKRYIDGINHDATEHAIIERNGNIGLGFYMPICFIQSQAANEYLLEKINQYPEYDWSIRYRGIPDEWHATISEAMDALYGKDRDEAKSNAARAAITRSVARLTDRNLMLRNAIFEQKRAYDGAAFSLTYDGVATI